MNAMATEERSACRLYHDQELADVAVQPFAAGQAALISIRCPGKPTRSEDCAALIPFGPEAGILVVADGLGGLPAGEQAATVAIGRLAHSVAAAVRDGIELRGAILNGFEEANRAVIDLSIGAATTLAVVEIQGRFVRPYHVGDSMSLVVGQRGKVKLRTVSHSPVGYAVEAGFLDHAAAMHHEERHLISNMIGSSDMHITIGSAIELSPLDTVLVASDGLADNLHLEEIIERLRKGPLARVARTLAEDSIRRMTTEQDGEPSKPDDLTAIVYRQRVES